METIKKILKEQGRSQVWLSRRLGVSPMTLNHWLQGRRVMPNEYGIRTALILGVQDTLLFVNFPI